MIRDEKSNHIVCRLLRKKGFKKFEVYNSRHLNQWGGWWVESDELTTDNNFLGVTLKDAIHTLKNTDQIK